MNPLISKVPYGMEKDFIPNALTATGPNMLVVAAHSPYKSLADTLAAARAKPGDITFGTSGPGNRSHLATEMLMRQGQVKMVNVPCTMNAAPGWPQKPASTPCGWPTTTSRPNRQPGQTATQTELASPGGHPKKIKRCGLGRSA